MRRFNDYYEVYTFLRMLSDLAWHLGFRIGKRMQAKKSTRKL